MASHVPFTLSVGWAMRLDVGINDRCYDSHTITCMEYRVAFPSPLRELNIWGQAAEVRDGHPHVRVTLFLLTLPLPAP